MRDDNTTSKEFDDIRPYEDGEVRQAFNELLTDRHFLTLIRSYVPWMPKPLLKGLLRLSFIGVKTPLGFQKRFMRPVVHYIIRKHTDGCTLDDTTITHSPTTINRKLSPSLGKGLEVSPRFTFISNHRDIVLDPALLDVMLVDLHYPTTVEIGIGDNLLIYPWIRRIVRMNKAFIVRRGLSPRETLLASKHMSRYIHYAVNEKKENIWIAQREGRAKDSSDQTQEAVLKMLAMGSDEQQPADRLRELNIIPLTISYEYDPCDYLKAQEFQLKRDNPAYKKSRQDDLDNMRIGILGYKGRVHYHCGTPVNQWIDELGNLPNTEFYTALARHLDREIHANYQLYPNNYIADDLLNNTDTHASHYTSADKQRFEEYLNGQIDKIDISDKDEAFLRERLLTMYANPLRNKLKITTPTTHHPSPLL